MALSPEILVPRLGEVLITDGLITEIQLKHALEEQIRVAAAGKWKRIGEILIELGYINRESLNQAVTNQILKFQQALVEANKTLEARVSARTAELEAANRKLSELDILKSNFISNVSHELRTPLTHIKGYIDLALAENCIKDNPEVYANLQVVQRSTERLENLINDLITFSLAETGQLSLKIESFNIIECAQLSISHYEQTAASKNISIHQLYSSEAIYVNADRNKISWVLNQLIDNSIKYMKKPGVISIQITTKSDKAVIKIVDDGVGFNLAQLEDAFLPFHQLNGGPHRLQGGLGIGLTLAKIIIEAHNTEIIVESQPSVGSQFLFELPLSSQ